MRIPTAFLLFLLPLTTAGQAVDNLASFRIINADRYVRLNYENDYFTATDYYYTQGINMEVVSPSLSKFPLTRILLRPKMGIHTDGISVEHNGYTPTSIEHNEILYGDRPFAAALMLKTFSASGNSDRRYRITSSFTLGMVGPGAGGYEMQKSIHQWIHGTEPLGWQHQIQNDLIVNCEAGIEKSLVTRSDQFLLNTFGSVRAGTYNTKLSTGFVAMLGRLNPATLSVFGKNYQRLNVRKAYFHLYAQPMINAVGYDATLQGGLIFNRNSPYTLSAQEIERLTFQFNYGAVLSFRSLYLEYFQTFLTQEFEMGFQHRWGGIRIGIAW